ncbi:fibrinogen-binding protein [Staphylococcus aureus]|nr:fibrinogen-binding protein [Staphylococcus aureus]
MKNKLIAKSLLGIAVIGMTATTLASTADASEGYGPREKKPVSINHNIVEYNDGTFKYQSRPKFNTTPQYIKFRHDYNIVEYNDVHLDMVHVRILINQLKNLMRQ